MALSKGVFRVARPMHVLPVFGKRRYTYDPKLDPPSFKDFPLADRPEGVPDTWSAKDIVTDLGFFEDDCFPPALPGETLEEYCRRVPNIWSPCSRHTDVVDCPVWLSLEFAQDILCEDHQFSERPMVKIPPLDSDWHAMHEVEMDLANPPDPFKLNGVNPPMATPHNLLALESEAEEIMKMIHEGAARLGHGYWFQSDNFADFWLELTGKPLMEVPLEEHIQAWLEANPDMTMNEIEQAINPVFEGFGTSGDKKFDPNRKPKVLEETSQQSVSA
jgi:hypothetical protein